MDPITIISNLFGLDPAIVGMYIPIIILVCNFIARLIPDDSTGFLGFIEKIVKVLGLYASNRISSGISLSDVGKATIAVAPTVKEVAQQTDPTNLSENTGLASDLYEKQGRDKFVPDEFKTILFVFLLVPLLLLQTACATTATTGAVTIAQRAREAVKIMCVNREALQFILNSVRPNPTADKVQPLLDYLHQYCPLFFAEVDPVLYEQTLTIDRSARNVNPTRMPEYAAR